MNLDEAKQILKNNGYKLINELTLDTGEDIDYYQKDPQVVHNFLKNPGKANNLKHTNDAYPLSHVSNKSTTKIRNFSVDSVFSFKKLIFNTGTFKGKRTIKKDLSEILEYPEIYRYVLNYLNRSYNIDINKFKEMLENNTEKLFDICLKIWFLYLTGIFTKCSNGQLLLYRGIGLPKNMDVNKFIKNNNLGTSWSINYQAAENFAYSTDFNKNDAYIITARLYDINDIDIATSLLCWYRANPFADIYQCEDEIRIRNSKNLDIISVEKVD